MDTLSYPLRYSWVTLQINKARYEFFSPFFLHRLILPLTCQYPSVPPRVSIRMSFDYKYNIMYKGTASQIDATEVAAHSDPLANWTYTRGFQTA